MKSKISILISLVFCVAFAKSQSYNTATGTYALANNSTGGSNTATGYQALYSLTGGFNNSAHGAWALYSNDGDYNSAYGGSAMFYNTSGYQNSALGFRALYSNTTGFRNVACGADALFTTDGTQLNTAVGYQALYASPSGNFNTALGASSGINCTASYNTYLGASTGANSTGYTNCTAIGYQATVTQDNMMRFGNSSVTSIIGTVNWSWTSDKRIKKDIVENVPGLSFIKLLKPVTFHFDLDAEDAIIQPSFLKDKEGRTIPFTAIELQSRKAKEAIAYSGFLAQDVEAAAKSIHYDFSAVVAPKNEKQLYSIRYAEFVVPLVKATQELSVTHDSLQQVVSDLTTQVNLALAEIAALKSAQDACCTASEKTTSSPSNTKNIKTDNAGLKGGYLEQNIPNPFRNATTIRYHLPGAAENAQIVISTVNGQLLKTFHVSEKNAGQLIIGGGELAAGTYIYSLLVNGQRTDSKRMIVTK
ncbi:MAG: tail fiber domain-containing protein [Bacteroidota bacterium]